MSTTAIETMSEVVPPANRNRRTMSEARWKDVIRPYTKEEVERLRGTVKIEYTLARLSMFHLARGYRERGMSDYAELQESEFAAETDGYTATRHQREVGTGYFDEVI